MSGLDDTVPASGDEPVLAHGALPTKISRYEVEGKLGEGGNGVVLLARDPLLGRKVAIKILRSADDSGEASQRLLREARAAAKLTHDNVIVIHEVGTFEERVFVAMEHVSGSSLARWQGQHEWREVLEVYVRAGRGLAAAHAAGLVHRDFKPDNVLVANDGRVRVTDFGIVSGIGIDSNVRAPKSPDGATAETSLTRTGTIMGTPRYMAPEQHLAHTVDARADQFSFCVSLYEGLFRTQPFVGATYAELATHVLDGEPAPPPADSPVPAAIRDAIMRGLSRAPEDRFASMNELLAALAVAPVAAIPSRRRWGVMGALAVVASCIVAWFAYPRASSAPAARPADAATADARPADAHVPDADLAAEAFARAEAAYQAGDYQTAIDNWKQVYETMDLSGTAPVLYDMGQAYKKAGNCREAIFAFRRYLGLMSPSEPVTVRKDVEKTIEELAPCAERQAEEELEAKEKLKRAKQAAGSATIDAR